MHHYLIAEDEKDTQFLVQRAYENLGLTVPIHFVDDGQEVIDYLEGKGRFTERTEFPLPVLILLDLKMPRKNGLEVLGWLRGSPFREMVVVMFSGSDMERDVGDAYRLGVNSFIHKPTSFSDLQHVISVIHHYWFGCNYLPQPGEGITSREEMPFKIVTNDLGD